MVAVGVRVTVSLACTVVTGLELLEACPAAPTAATGAAAASRGRLVSCGRGDELTVTPQRVGVGVGVVVRVGVRFGARFSSATAAVS